MFAVAADSAAHPVDLLVDRVLDEFDPASNPYLRSLVEQSMERERFVTSQRQFCHAVDYFSRPMAVLASRLPHPEQRVDILHNVWEEHGEGDLTFHHGATFRRFLTVLAGSAEVPAAVAPPVGMFNATLAGVCSSDDPFAGVAALGIIERMFADISAMIGDSVVSHGWVAARDLVHYTTHATLDLEHADEFFGVVRGDWHAMGASGRGSVERGMYLGAYAFDELYRGLARWA